MKKYEILKNMNTIKDCTEDDTLTNEELMYPYVSQIGAKYDYYLHGEIKSSENYIPLFNMLSHAEENDIITIYINSQGGDLFTALAIRDSICLCDAHINIFVQGLCASSATVVMLSFNGNSDIIISPNSEIMIHSYETGMYGKHNELNSKMEFTTKWFENVIKDVYGGFLTEKEMQFVLNGTDYYFNAEETRKRIDSKINFLLKENKKRK